MTAKVCSGGLLQHGRWLRRSKTKQVISVIASADGETGHTWDPSCAELSAVLRHFTGGNVEEGTLAPSSGKPVFHVVDHHHIFQPARMTNMFIVPYGRSHCRFFIKLNINQILPDGG